MGANGQLGSEMRCLSTLHPEFSFTFSDVADTDITSQESLRSHFETVRPEVVINCAAYTAVDRAESEPEPANAINRKAVELLADFSREFGFLLIHISTDYVFDGTSCRPYLETDPCNPVSVYGRTKRAGEEALLARAQRAVLVRTGWLFSSYGNNFVKTMRRVGEEKQEISVVTDQIGTPTYAADLAEAIVKILPQIKDKQKTVYHFTNEGVCSWYDFAVEIMMLSKLKCKVNAIPSSAYPTKAVRPFYSVLSKEKIKQDFNLNIPHWKE